MELLIKPATDITFHEDGLIELSARLVRALDLSEGDYINFGPGCSYVTRCGYGLKVRKSKKTQKAGGFMRANSKYICGLMTSDDSPIAKFRMGEKKENTVQIITRINYAKSRD